MKKVLLIFSGLFCSLYIFAQPEIEFKENLFDFGIINRQIQPNLNHKFEFSNIGNEPLIIYQIFSTYADVVCPRESINPGETGFIVVNYNTNKWAGDSFNRRITIRTNGKEPLTTIRIKGEYGVEESLISKQNSSTASVSASSIKQDADYGTSSKHGKIMSRSSEQHGTATFTRERYEDGYSSIFIMDKCKACGGTGKVGFNFCTAGCAMGITTLLTYYDQNGNEVESTGTMANHNNPYSSGGSGGSYSGSSSSGSSSSSSSVYTKCTSCNGTGRCSSCNGRGYKFNSYAGHDDECPSCRGKGSCPICYGRGKL